MSVSCRSTNANTNAAILKDPIHALVVMVMSWLMTRSAVQVNKYNETLVVYIYHTVQHSAEVLCM